MLYKSNAGKHSEHETAITEHAEKGYRMSHAHTYTHTHTISLYLKHLAGMLTVWPKANHIISELSFYETAVLADALHYPGW